MTGMLIVVHSQDLAVTAGGWYLSVIAVVGGMDLSSAVVVCFSHRARSVVDAEGREGCGFCEVTALPLETPWRWTSWVMSQS